MAAPGTGARPEMDVEGRKILVLGLARTGLAAARFLARRGARVVAVDAREEERMAEAVSELSRLPVTCRFGAEETRWLDGVDAVVPSPGVPKENPLLAEAALRDIEVLSEIELAARCGHTPLVAITGTNGKTTTTRLLGEILGAAGLRVFVGGNIGNPLIDCVDGTWDWGVVEVSSFQLEWVRDFRPRVALCLNLSEDHLDRYDGLSSYGAAKARIFAAQGPDDVAVLNRDDPWVWGLRRELRARVVSFGWSETDRGAFVAGDEVVWRGPEAEERFPLRDVRLRGVHNVENVMAAVCAAKAVGVAEGCVRDAARRFPGVEHRLEFVRELDGVRYYNDSKGTNVGAVRKSLASFDGPVVLIAGGVHKGGAYRPLAPLVRERVRKLILLGASAGLMNESLGALTDTVMVDGLDAAVREARAAARAGDVVLLSPACSSFDMFESYAERGRVFKELVQAL